MPKVYQFIAEGYFAGEVEDYGLLPNNATRIAPLLQDGYIPRWTGTAWEQVENHKGKQGYVNGQPFTITEYGAFPEGWSDTPPPPTLTEARARKLEEIAQAYASVLAYVIAPEGKDALAAALAVADFTTDDPEGLAFIRTKLAANKKELEEAVNAAGSVEDVNAVSVSFDV